MSFYKTLKGYGEAELIEKRSRFIGYANRAECEEEALDFLNSIRSKHSDATHNVYAYVLRDNNIARFSDDGEPHSSAGLPVLDVLRKEGIFNAVIVVTRYFGGTLLGVGGLVRAYSSSAKAAVDAAGITEIIQKKHFEVITNYSDFQKVSSLLASCRADIQTPVFDASVSFVFSIPEENAGTVITKIADVSCGRAGIKEII